MMKFEKQFLEVVGLIKQARTDAYIAVNASLINCYWQVGYYISQRIANAGWGEKTVEALAGYIERNHPDLKGYNRRGLYRMKQFYDTYHSSLLAKPSGVQNVDNDDVGIVSAVRAQIKNNNNNNEFSDIRRTILAKVSWTNHRAIFTRCRTEEEREFYLNICIQEKLNTRELERQLSAGLFERAMLGKYNNASRVKHLNSSDNGVFKDTYVFDFLNLPKDYTESDLQKALISQMKDFILELGKDFLFMGEGYRLQVGNSDFEVDLLFFHRGLQCLVVFELKAEKFKPEHLGQLNFYLEALDRDVKKDHENPSIGILLCKDQDAEVVKYALNRSLSPALVAAYQMQLPDKRLLQQKLKDIYRRG